ncbi:uncharacterized protein DEA37_0011999 [Paragonimus westermani]|uniref:EGF-like domain-containing protein n=1 Tax=Paragonimus westermani TaxID=34504 RepID=A0A5J4NY18_9TREM|nr:uncharacterized protein DEA37_0011999 [Paragonimus westermani]
MYGFPLDFVGGQIGTVYMEAHECSKNKWLEKGQCAYMHVIKHCQLPVDSLKNFTYTAKDCTMDVDPKENVPQRKQISLTISSSEKMHYVGQYNSEHISSLSTLFTNCATSCKNLKLTAGVYTCDFLAYLNTLGSGKRNLKHSISWDMSEEKLYGLFLYWLCHVTWPKLRELNPGDIRLDIMILCPNPCSVRAARCSRIPNTLTPVRSPVMLAAFSESSCIQLGTDLTDNNYECLCKPGYQWDASSKQCVLKDLCAEDAELAQMQEVADSERLCFPAGTLRCVPFASQPLKKPMYGSPEEMYRDELKVLCHNGGYCVESPDHTNYKCLCQYGWQGEFCDIRDVRHWLPWSSWSLCSASLCGGSGWQQRQRQCRVPVNRTTGYGQCEGGGIELRPCTVGCIHPLQTFVPMIKIVLMFAMCLLLLQLAVGFTLLVLRFDIVDRSTGTV